MSFSACHNKKGPMNWYDCKVIYILPLVTSLHVTYGQTCATQLHVMCAFVDLKISRHALHNILKSFAQYRCPQMQIHT